MSDLNFEDNEYKFCLYVIEYLKSDIVKEKFSLSFSDFKIDYYFFPDEKYNDDIFCKTFIVTNLKMNELIDIYATSPCCTYNFNGVLITDHYAHNTHTVLVRVNENDTSETMKMYEYAIKKYGTNINIYEHRLSDKAELEFFKNNIIPLSEEIYKDIAENYSHDSFYLGIEKINLLDDDNYHLNENFIVPNNEKKSCFSSNEIKLKIKGIKIYEEEVKKDILINILNLINEEACHYGRFSCLYSYLSYLKYTSSF